MPQFVTGNPRPIVLRLYFQDRTRQFFVDAFYRERPVAIRSAVEKIPCRPAPSVLIDARASQVSLAPLQFFLVRDWIERAKALSGKGTALCEVDGIARRLQKTQVPDWFAFLFLLEDGALKCRLPQDVIPLLGAGWFLHGEAVWHCGISDQESAMLQRKIEGPLLLRFLRDMLPDWQNRGIPFTCPLPYGPHVSARDIFPRDDIIPASLQKRTGDGFASIEIDEGRSPASAAIPKRSLQPPASVGSSLKKAYESAEQRFYKSALSYVDRVEQAANLMPFTTYWPTYESMTAAQLRWYFYWRAQARQEYYPKTYAAYIFLYAYELLNLVGCDSPQQAYDRLFALWVAYRKDEPKLNIYFGNWLADLALLHNLNAPMQQIAALSADLFSAILLNLELHRRMSADPVDLDLPMLLRISDYDITQSKFYQTSGKELIEQALPKVAVLVDAYLKKSGQQRLVEAFAPEPAEISYHLFRSAVYAGEVRDLKLTILPLNTYPPLRELMTQIMRHTENKLREVWGVSGRLRVTGLDPELQRLIGLYVRREFTPRPVQEEAPAITIDRERLAKLAQEAKETTRMLMTQDAEEPDSSDDGTANGAVCVMEDEEMPDEICGRAPAPAEVTAEPWKSIMGRLSPGQGAALRILACGGDKSELLRIADEEGTMAELLLEEINEAAMEAMGDLLIEGGELIEEYRGTIQSIFAGKGQD